MNDCRSIRSLISGALDEPSETPVPEIARHLGDCAECRVFQAEAAAMGARLGRPVAGDGPASGDGSDEVPRGLHEGIMAAVVAAEQGGGEILPFWRRPVVVVLGVAAAMAVAVLVMWDRGDGGVVTPALAEVGEAGSGARGLPSGFEVPIDITGLVASAGRGLPEAFGSEGEAIVADVGRLRDFFRSRFPGVGRGGG